jgi:DNA-binding transcriptional MerR regulator
MEKSELTSYSTGELADKCGVTIRTIQYYDRKRLLKAEIGANGRRIYYDADIMRLIQILFLKSFGFPLEEIRDRLFKVNTGDELKFIFEQQKSVLMGKITDLQNAVSMLDKTVEEIGNGSEVNIGRLMAMISIINQRNKFVLNYFGNEQLTELMTRFANSPEAETFSAKSENIISKLLELYRQGLPPESEEGQKLAQQWWDMVNEFTNGDRELLKTLMSVGVDVDNWPDEVKDFKEAVIHFLTDALNIYFKNKGIILTS